MRRIRRIAGLGFAAWALAGAPRIAADVPPPPDSPETKRVPATIEVDWGPVDALVSHRHVVAAGETLRSIATKELGDASRSKAIAQANADVIKDPDRIRVGEVLWLPSKASFEHPAKGPPDAATPAPEAGYDAFWAGGIGPRRRFLVARATPGEVPPEQRAGATLVLVPHGMAEKPLSSLARGSVPMEPADFEAWAMATMIPDTLVHREDPTVRIVTKYALTGVKGTEVLATADRVRYDAAGAVVTKTWVVPPPSYEYARPKADAGVAKDEAPPPPPGSPPAPAGMVEPSPAPVAAPGARADEPRGNAPPAPSEDGRWPAWIGLLVAGAGAAAVGVMWAVRRRGTPPAPPPA
jgi:nucleoid-associated protein YgaU